MIRPEQALAFLAALPIDRFHGVGPATARRMRELGIACGADLQARSEQELVAAFGRVGGHYWRIAMARTSGRSSRTGRAGRLSVETTFDRDLRDEAALDGRRWRRLAEELAARVERAGFLCRTLTLKVRYADFAIASRRTTRPQPFVDGEAILAAGVRAAGAAAAAGPTPIRLLGLGVSEPRRRGGAAPAGPAAHGSWQRWALTSSSARLRSLGPDREAELLALDRQRMRQRQADRRRWRPRRRSRGSAR